MADGYLTFDTKLNTTGFKAGLGSLTSAFGKLAALAGVAFSVAAVVQFGKAGVQAASEMGAKFKGLEFLMKANNRSMSQATAFLQSFTNDGLVPMTSAYEAYKNMVSRGYSTDQIEKMLTVMKDAAVYNRQGQFSMGEAIEKATMGLRMENSLLTDSVGIQKNVAKMWAEYAKEIGTTANNLTMAQKRQAEFNGFMREGGVFSGAAAEYANSYAGKVSTITAAFLNLKIAVGNAVIPFINALLPAITQAILWFTKLFNIIGQVANLLFGTNVGMVDAEQAIADSAQAGADAMGEMADNTEAAGKAAKGALASFDKLNVLSQETASGGSAGGGGGVPIVGDQTGDGGLMKALDDAMPKVKKYVEDFKKDVQETGWFNAVMQNLYEALTPVRGWVKTNIMDPIQKWFAELWQDVQDGAANALNWIGQQYGKNWQKMRDVAAIALNTIGGLFTWLGEQYAKNWQTMQDVAAIALNAIGSFFAGAWDSIKGVWNGAVGWFQTTVLNPISNAFRNAWSAIKIFMQSPFVGLGNFVRGIFNGVIGFINGLLIGIVSGINSIVDRINSLSFTPPRWAQDLLGVGTIGFNLRRVSAPRIPLLATGAVIPPNAPFTAVLGDQRRGTNIEAPLKTIEQAVDNALARRGAGMGGTISFDVDESGLMRYLHPKFQAESRRIGTSLAKASAA